MTPSDESRTVGGSPYLMVATLAPHDATTTLFFSTLAAHAPLRIVQVGFRDRTQPLATLKGDLAVTGPLSGASALIVVRGLFECRTLVSCAERMRIPRYYFLDDNFMVLKDEAVLHDEHFGVRYSDDNVRSALATFSGVLLSTSSLVDYFLRKGLHGNIVYYPPVAGSVDVQVRRQREEIAIAFFGGAHRREPFMAHVFPAICRLARDRDVALFAAGIDLEGVAISERLRVIPIAYNPSYQDALRNMASHGIDILVHPSSETQNNVYKNCHFLINARALGAAPIFSDVPPYDTLAGEEVCELCLNSADAWFESISRLVADTDTRLAISTKLNAFCETHFSGKENLQVLNHLLETHAAPTAWTRRARVGPIAMSVSWGFARDLVGAVIG